MSEQTKEALIQRRDELRQRLEQIKRDFGSGLEQDAQERAIQLENVEVLEEIARVTESELAKVEEQLSKMKI